MTENDLGERPPCAICGIEGILLTPFGLMCYRDGFAAASEETAEIMTGLVNQDDSAPIQGVRGGPGPVTVSA